MKSQIDKKNARKSGRTIVKTNTAYDDQGLPEVVYEAFSDGSADFHLYGSLRDRVVKAARRQKVSLKRFVMQLLTERLDERKAAIAASKAVVA